MLLKRLSGRKLCTHVLQRGQTWKGKTMTAKWLPGPPRHPHVNPSVKALYMGTYASTKLHASAVTRNRMRRRVREALRLEAMVNERNATAQLLISPRSASLEAPFEDIRRDAASLLHLLSSLR